MELALPDDFQADEASQVLNRAREILDLPPDAELRVENVTRNSHGTRIVFTYTHAVELDDEELQNVAGIRVDVNSHGDLRFDTRGCLLSYNIEPADPSQLRAIGDHLCKLVANDQVYIAIRGEKVDPEVLRQLGKPWYIEEDEQGNKHLKRAWIS